MIALMIALLFPQVWAETYYLKLKSGNSTAITLPKGIKLVPLRKPKTDKDDNDDDDDDDDDDPEDGDVHEDDNEDDQDTENGFAHRLMQRFRKEKEYLFQRAEINVYVILWLIERIIDHATCLQKWLFNLWK